jgi:hypothetical protein
MMKFWEFGYQLCKALGYEKVPVKSVQINLTTMRDYPEIIITREFNYKNEEDRRVLDVLTAANWKNVALEPQSTEQKEQYDAAIKDYLNGVHHKLFDALMQTRNEPSKDVQAKRVIDILLAQRMGK